ncbi:hypothetical protein HAZT_HAZT004216 [Hyalella azteca]|nr:hypothetical protein HAZT_HAZT004216 [Hyalella azteca]
MVIFLAGINQTQDLTLCRFVAVSLHYFILASFGWMLVEGIHHYLVFVKVFDTYIPKFIWKASICAWGLPFIPILGLLVYDSALYDSRDQYSTGTLICWISPLGFRYAFLPPLVLILAINLVLYIRIINGTACKRPKLQSNKSDTNLKLNQLSMAITVFFLLGFTWIFGLLTITGKGEVFAYFFTIFNTLQGFFIFVFHVCQIGSVRRQWSTYFDVVTCDIPFPFHIFDRCHRQFLLPIADRRHRQFHLPIADRRHRQFPLYIFVSRHPVTLAAS